jgi:hypothetical protein
MRITAPAALALVALAAAPAPAAEKPSAKWMAHCAANLKDEGIKPAVVRRYCACMGGIGEEAEVLSWTQTDLERSYPPAHRQCFRRARGLPAPPE